MEERISTDSVRGGVLLHLFSNVVFGTLNSLKLALSFPRPDVLKGPSYGELRILHDHMNGDDKVVFYKAIATVIEFTVFCMLDFIENYNRFSSETCHDEYPRLSLFYNHKEIEDVVRYSITKFGTKELSDSFKKMVNTDEKKKLLEDIIKKLALK